MLRLVVPVSQADVHLLPSFVGVLRHLGPIGDHYISLVPAPSVVAQANQAAQELQTIAPGRVGATPLNEEPHSGWPLAPNQHFKATVGILDSAGNNLPWFWCELDQTPLVPGWLDMLDTDYQRALQEKGTIYMGTVVPTRIIGQDGQVVENHPEYAPHMVGSGIYPAKFSRLSGWVYPAIMVNKPETAEVQAFDVQMRDEVRPKCHDSKLMQHMWSTVNYHQNGTGIVCEDKPGNPWGTSHCGRIRDGVVILHGCKDGSLAKMITGKDFSVKVPVTVPVEPAPAPRVEFPKQSPAESVISPNLADLERRVAALEAKLSGAPSAPATIDPFEASLMRGLASAADSERQTKDDDAVSRIPKPIEWGKKPKAAEEAPVEPTETIIPPEKVYAGIVDMLKASNKAMRLGAVAKTSGFTKEILIELAGAADCAFEVTGSPPGWVKLKTTVPV